ncbi:MAG: TolB family protein [Gaiellaceae bacterium]
MSARGTGLKRLTTNKGRDVNPVWSPDGKKLAFESDRSGNDEIYVMNLATLRVTNLTRNPARDSDPTWSPDGQSIAFASERDGNSEIYVMSAATGGNQTRLTNNPAVDLVPNFWQQLRR